MGLVFRWKESEENTNIKINRRTIRKKPKVGFQFYFYNYYNHTLLPVMTPIKKKRLPVCNLTTLSVDGFGTTWQPISFTVFTTCFCGQFLLLSSLNQSRRWVKVKWDLGFAYVERVNFVIQKTEVRMFGASSCFLLFSWQHTFESSATD